MLLDERFIGVVLSDKCNLQCNYCFLRNMNLKPKASYETLSSILRWVSEQFPKESIRFYLGYAEPLMEFNTLQKLAEEAYNYQNIGFLFLTNGTLLDKEKLEWLRKHHEKVSVILSLDGDKEACKDRVTSGGKTVSDLIDMERVFGEYRDVISKVSCTLSPSNVGNFHKNIMYMLDVLGIKGFELSFRVDCDWSDEEVRIADEELSKVYQEYISRYGTDKQFKKLDVNNGYLCATRKYRYFYIDFKGKIYPCFLGACVAGNQGMLIGDISEPFDYKNYVSVIDKMEQERLKCNCELSNSCCLVCPNTQVLMPRRYKNVCSLLRTCYKWERKEEEFMRSFEELKETPLYKAVQAMDLIQEEKHKLLLDLVVSTHDAETDICIEALTAITQYLKQIKEGQDKLIEKLGLIGK